MRRLNHPNAVQVIDSGLTDDNQFFVAMEYVNGRNLSQIIREEGPLNPARLSGFLDQIASVLDAAHDSNIIHRDIKPANIMVFINPETGQEHVKLIGFVFAKILAEGSQAVAMTQAGMTVGTPSYMSPEQAMGKTTTKWSDIYSLGVLISDSLTDRLPFNKSDLQTMLAHVKEDVQDIQIGQSQCADAGSNSNRRTTSHGKNTGGPTKYRRNTRKTFSRSCARSESSSCRSINQTDPARRVHRERR